MPVMPRSARTRRISLVQSASTQRPHLCLSLLLRVSRQQLIDPCAFIVCSLEIDFSFDLSVESAPVIRSTSVSDVFAVAVDSLSLCLHILCQTWGPSIEVECCHARTTSPVEARYTPVSKYLARIGERSVCSHSSHLVCINSITGCNPRHP